jgi:nicotinate-nucleotide adenylyltransferase
MRIAFFGGSFDPPHLGHLAIARAALQSLALDRVLFAPVALQPLKSQGSSASFENRVAMTRLAIQKDPAFELSLADAPVSGNPRPNYTIDTLAHLRDQLPPATELCLLLGEDSFHTLHHWHRAADLLFAANLIIATRPDTSSDFLDRACSALTDAAALAIHLPDGISIAPLPAQPNHYRLTNAANASSELIVLPNLHYDISSTELRRLIHNDPDHPAQAAALLPPSVLDYIHQHHLYQ